MHSKVDRLGVDSEVEVSIRGDIEYLSYGDRRLAGEAEGTLVNNERIPFGLIQLMPKLELHAHLFGSVPREFLRIYRDRLCNSSKESDETGSVHLEQDPEGTDLVSAFRYFKWVYGCIRDLKSMEEMTRHVLESFHKENVIYLELRTTLKNMPKYGINPFNYMEMLNRCIDWCESSWGMKTRLLLSVDREKCQTLESTQMEFDWIKECVDKYGKYIVGLDICGNPEAENMTYIFEQIDSMLLAPESPYSGRLKWTCHTAEMPREEESWNILRRKPNRIGHGCYLTPEQVEFVKNNNIVVETCPTSNVSTMGLQHINEHPFVKWYADKSARESFCIATDDSGLFDTTLSQDLAIVADECNWKETDLIHLQERAVQHSFLSDTEKRELDVVFRKKIIEWITAAQMHTTYNPRRSPRVNYG